jgi:ribonuclease HI
MIKSEMMFNHNTLNIFTDASITKTPEGETVGCAGCYVVSGDNATSVNLIEIDTRIVRWSTSNNSEIHAVKLGVEKALQYGSNYKVINLISDSKLCIYGLREWVFNWIRDSKGLDYLVGSTNQEVANQEVILQIIYMILDNNLSINLYHQNGHVKVNDPRSLAEAKKTFIESNFLRHDVDMNLIRNISIANDAIDKFTRNTLGRTMLPKVYPNANNIVKYIYMPFDAGRYAYLINRR